MRASRALLIAFALLSGCCPADRMRFGCADPDPPESKDEGYPVGQTSEQLCYAEPCPWCTILRRGDRADLAAYAPDTLRRIDFGQALTLQDVRALVALGFCERFIAYQLVRTQTQFNLTEQLLKQLSLWGIPTCIVEQLDRQRPINEEFHEEAKREALKHEEERKKQCEMLKECMKRLRYQEQIRPGYRGATAIGRGGIRTPGPSQDF
jgi:hypothetical protein